MPVLFILGGNISYTGSEGIVRNIAVEGFDVDVKATPLLVIKYFGEMKITPVTKGDN